MWNLKSIKARNICTFQKLEYNINKNVATIIFGENEDDGDNQKRNGSGKSSFMEAIGFGITGEAFKKVNSIEEIIRDDEDYAEVELDFYNHETDLRMIIKRRIERGESQKVDVNLVENEVPSYLPFISVQDMNKRIFEILGISKADLYNNYLLNNNRFKSFFDASDKEKKEIINTFSNGILVDEAIEALKLDIADAEEELSDAELKVAEVDGKISAFQSQIDTAKEKAAETEEKKKQTIQEYKNSMADERATIRENKDTISKLSTSIDAMNKTADKVDELRDEDMDFESKYKLVRKMLYEHYADISMSDWGSKIKSFTDDLEALKKNHDDLVAGTDEFSKDIEAMRAQLEKAKKEYEENCKKLDAKDSQDIKEREEIEDDILKYTKKLDDLKEKASRKSDEIEELENKIKRIAAQIRGSVECPQCHHQFILDTDKTSVEELVAMSDGYKGEKDLADSQLDDTNKALDDAKKYLDDCKLDLQDVDKDIEKRKEFRNEYKKTVRKYENDLEDLESELETRNKKIEHLESRIEVTNKSIESVADDMIDEAVDILESSIKTMKLTKKSLEQRIEMAEQSIAAYQESIKKLEESTVADVIAQVKVHLEEAEAEKKKADAVKAEKKKAVDVLKEQEVLFAGFKTHLANTKINSIAQITNQVLQDVGSTLRVRLSGYTTTKTGKVRDKIYISVERDGEDKGSFLKCSAGEKARIMFANIVAMHRMTNLTSESGGFNLICIDEIMDSCEEAGIMGVADIANKLGITLLLITQGMTSEGYPHHLVVRKYCGVSTISRS